jgi:CHAT domain-containing protein
MSVIVTTAQAQNSYSWERIGSEKFTEKLLNEKIKLFRAALSRPDSDGESAGRELYDILIGPIAAQLADSEILLLVPDRRLRFIPFGALKSPTYFLAEKYKIALVTDTKSFISFPGPKTSEVRIEAFGTGIGKYGLPPLLSAQSELSSIVKSSNGQSGVFPGRIHFDAAFSKESLRVNTIFGQGVRGFVHIASHFVLADSVKSSYLLLGTGERFSMSDLNGSGNLFNIDFRQADLLVLSACETGDQLGGGDGSSLQSFGLIAENLGARGVIASLWSINDLSTSIFMPRLYEALGRKTEPIDALTSVQRAFINGALATDGALPQSVLDRFKGDKNKTVRWLQRLRHPYYWAPFVLLGRWAE